MSDGNFSQDEVAKHLRSFLVDNHLIPRDNSIVETDSLFESGIIDSLAIFELTTFIESRYGCRVDEDDLVPENFDSLVAISAYVCGKLAADG